MNAFFKTFLISFLGKHQENIMSCITQTNEKMIFINVFFLFPSIFGEPNIP